MECRLERHLPDRSGGEGRPEGSHDPSDTSATEGQSDSRTHDLVQSFGSWASTQTDPPARPFKWPRGTGVAGGKRVGQARLSRGVRRRCEAHTLTKCPSSQRRGVYVSETSGLEARYVSFTSFDRCGPLSAGARTCLGQWTPS